MFSKRGFTLIELIVVVIIVGILAAATIPMMRGNIHQAMSAEGMAIAGSIRTAQRAYFAQHNTYTQCLTALGISTSDYEGKYYGGAGHIQMPVGNATHFTVTICGITDGDADGDWISMDQDGELNDNI